MEKQLNYSNLSLIPSKCIVNSRSECITQTKLGKFTFDMPVVAANMKSVVDIDTCKFFARNNWFYIMHRFGIDNFDFIVEMQEENLFTSISVGINEDSYESLKTIYNEPLCVDFITIDVANAWSEKTHKMIDFIKSNFPESFLIVGNIATEEAFKEIEDWGADAIRVGIAGGSACITRNKTGISRSMVNAILDCYQARDNCLIIADGGIIEHGDIAKALALGADIVQAGFLFAGYDQSSGNLIELEEKGRAYKEYYGSASKYNKEECKNIEGKKILVPYKGDMKNLLRELKEDLQSSISYMGFKDIKDFIGNQKYYLI